MSAFITIEDNIFEYTESRSRFIGICRRVRDDGEAAAALAEIRKQYGDCTHVCHAYITGSGSRSSDDGEPSGTAGVPIMESITSANLSETLVAVVRYFGGIKLGAGGLLRAYSRVAAQTLSGAGRIEVADCAIVKISLDYATHKKIAKRQLKSLYKIIGQEYNNSVELTCAVRDRDALKSEICALTQGRFRLEYLGERRVERPVLPEAQS